jgi:glycosyltransferase involved in cell wall biosynthesis
MHVLVEAMPAVLASHPDACCILVGGKHDLEADYHDFLARRITALGLTECVRLVGLQRNVPEWMQAMDVVVHASDNEPFGIVVIEAMALGKPVVAGATGGPREVITDRVNGLLAPYGDPDRLAGAILRYLDDPGFAQRAGRAARERAEQFSTKSYARRFVQALRDFASSSPVARTAKRALTQ